MGLPRHRHVPQQLQPDLQDFRRGFVGEEEEGCDRIGAVGSDEGGLVGEVSGAKVAEEAEVGEEEGGGGGREAEEERREDGGEAGAAMGGFR